ncbi:MAG: DNA-processing protein DprA [Clostridia bacterium]|nr:DNA-processing protein DprA [Clostridia bacterium]
MRILNEDERAIIFLDSFENIEYKHKKAIIDLYKKPSLIRKDASLLSKYLKRVSKPQIEKQLLLALFQDGYFDAAVETAIKGADDVLTLLSDGYAEELKNIPTPPLVLYARGNLSLLKKDKVAIVGSRKTMPLYLKKTEEISAMLTKSGVVVVTGIALGADTSAIKGGLDSGNIISVFAGEVVKVYPASANDLANKIIASGGLILSEYPYGRTPRVYSYPVRNRIIAGLSRGALIVSGEESSGARYTANYSLDFGREVFCLPYGLGQGGELCKSLVKNGATMVESASEIADCLNLTLKEENLTDLGLDEKQEILYSLIKQGVGNTDDLAEKSKLAIYEIISALGMLELKGLIVKDFSGNYGALK